MLLLKLSNLILLGILSALSLTWLAILFDLGFISFAINEFLQDISGQLYQKMSTIPVHEIRTEDFIENPEVKL